MTNARTASSDRARRTGARSGSIRQEWFSSSSSSSSAGGGNSVNRGGLISRSGRSTNTSIHSSFHFAAGSSAAPHCHFGAEWHRQVHASEAAVQRVSWHFWIFCFSLVPQNSSSYLHGFSIMPSLFFTFLFLSPVCLLWRNLQQGIKNFHPLIIYIYFASLYLCFLLSFVGWN